MKKSVCTYSAASSKFSVELEILCKINREITKNDETIFRDKIQEIANSLHEESMKLDPANAERAKEEKSLILSLFGDRQIFVEEIPNGYCSSYCCKHLPWFIVTTNKGRIKIGWRKRVINIDWSDSIIKDDAESLFPTEEVTKGDHFIHAWSYEDAKKYIDTLLK